MVAAAERLSQTVEHYKHYHCLHQPLAKFNIELLNVCPTQDLPLLGTHNLPTKSRQQRWCWHARVAQSTTARFEEAACNLAHHSRYQSLLYCNQKSELLLSKHTAEIACDLQMSSVVPVSHGRDGEES